MAEPDVLIVHDDRQIRDFFRDVLQEAGYDCTLARDGEEAVAEFRRSRPPLVITQLKTPARLG